MYHNVISFLNSHSGIIIPLVLICLTLWAIHPEGPCKVCKRCALMRSCPERTPPLSCPLFGGVRRPKSGVMRCQRHVPGGGAGTARGHAQGHRAGCGKRAAKFRRAG